MADRANLSISHHRYFKTLAVPGWLWFDLGESPELKLDQLLPLKDRAGPGEVEAAGEQGVELPCSGLSLHRALSCSPSQGVLYWHRGAKRLLLPQGSSGLEGGAPLPWPGPPCQCCSSSSACAWLRSLGSHHTEGSGESCRREGKGPSPGQGVTALPLFLCRRESRSWGSSMRRSVTLPTARPSRLPPRCWTCLCPATSAPGATATSEPSRRAAPRTRTPAPSAPSPPHQRAASAAAGPCPPTVSASEATAVVGMGCECPRCWGCRALPSDTLQGVSSLGCPRFPRGLRL